MWLCVPRQAHRCGEWSWAASNCLPLFKLTTGITHPIGLWSRSAGRHCLSAGIAIPLALIPHSQLKSCMVSAFNLFTESKFGKLGWLSLLHGLMRVCSKSLPGLISSLTLFSYPVSAHLKTHGFHGSHSFLIYSTDYVHIFTRQDQSSFLTENKTHWVQYPKLKQFSLADLAWKFCIKPG